MTEEQNNSEQEQVYHCTKCGEPVKEKDEFCPKCGVKFTQTIVKKSNGFQLYRIFLFGLMVLGGYVAYLSSLIMFGGKDTKTLIWAIQTSQIKVEWWREIIILNSTPSLFVSLIIVFVIYQYLFLKK